MSLASSSLSSSSFSAFSEDLLPDGAGSCCSPPRPNPKAHPESKSRGTQRTRQEGAKEGREEEEEEREGAREEEEEDAKEEPEAARQRERRARARARAQRASMSKAACGAPVQIWVKILDMDEENTVEVQELLEGTYTNCLDYNKACLNVILDYLRCNADDYDIENVEARPFPGDSSGYYHHKFSGKVSAHGCPHNLVVQCIPSMVEKGIPMPKAATATATDTDTATATATVTKSSQ